MNECSQNLRELEEIQASLDEQTKHLATLPFDKRTRRDGELSNLMFIVQGTLDYFAEMPKEEAMNVLTDLRARLQKLCDNPGSAGTHDEILSED
jgi:hypothetical protein